MSDVEERRSLPLHPLLFAAFPVLFLYAENLAETDLGDALLPLALSVLGAAVLTAVAGLALRDVRKGALAASVSLILFFSYGYVHRVLAGGALGRHRYLLPMWGLLWLVGLVLAARSHPPKVTRAMNAAGTILVLLNVVSIGAYNLGGAGDVSGFSRAFDGIPLRAEGPARDVYYLIVDRYGGEPALRAKYGIDNSSFVESLRSKGFFVADRSSGNYPRTLHSLASAMNMRHLHPVARRVGEDSSDGGPLRSVLEDHAVGRLFKRAGYRYVHVGSWWGPTAENRLADRNVRFGRLSEFSSVLLETTIAAPLAQRLGSGSDERRREYDRVRLQFRELGDASEGSTPSFVFAHLLATHPPYVFRSDGSFLPVEQKRRMSEAEVYEEQLTYVNRELQKLIDRLLSVPEAERPIIVIQGDEGPGERPESWVGASDQVLTAKFSILNALYLPGMDASPLPPTTTPVNTFRMIFREYLGAQLPRIPDDVYVFQDIDHLYRFEEITERLRMG